jgi:TatD DNase family protein
MTIDTHAHIDMDQYDTDRDDVIQRARDNGVEYIVNVGCDIESSLRAIELTEQYEFIYASAGIHPHDVKSIDDSTYDKLRELLAHPKVIALGETGLDFFKNYSPRDLQLTHFRKQVELAKELNKPLIIHCRDANKEIIEILSDYYNKGDSLSGIFHCFSGDQELADSALELGFYISFSGSVTFKKSEGLRDVAKTIPADRLFSETDCPFLAPIPMRGKRNEPAFVNHTTDKT